MAAQAYVLIEATACKGNDIVAALRAMPRTVQVDRVTGPYDVICILDLDSLDDLGPTVRDEIHAIEGIVRTTSCAVARPASG